jgi:hypothetical protein
MPDNLRIGYVPYSKDLSHPGDRRRLASWAKYNDVKLVLDNPLSADLLILSNNANFNYWIKKAKVPVILDLVDGYLGEEPTFLKDFFRNLMRAFKGKSNFGSITYTRALKKACRAANAIVVASPEQSFHIKPFNKNIFTILDDHSELCFSPIDINLHKKINCEHHERHLFWEGFGYTIKHFGEISSELDVFLRDNNIGLYILSTSEFPRWGGYIGKVNTIKLLKKYFPNSFENLHFQSWSIENLISCARESNLGIIPINIEDKFANLKSENKALSMWTLGLPIVASSTPAYKRLADNSNILITCDENQKFLEVLHEKLFNQKILDSEKFKITSYLDKYHNSRILSESWANVINQSHKLYSQQNIHK